MADLNEARIAPAQKAARSRPPTEAKPPEVDRGAVSEAAGGVDSAPYTDSVLPRIEAIRPKLKPQPFSGPDWIFEIKHDGFRGLAYLDDGTCELVSRNNHTYTRYRHLQEAIADQLEVADAILDGEIVGYGCLQAVQIPPGRQTEDSSGI